MSIRRVVKALVRNIGYDITRYQPSPSDGRQIHRGLLRPEDVRCVFDVGANVGQMTTQYRRVFPLATVYAFEADPRSASTLRSRVTDKMVCVVEKAVTDRNGEVCFHLNTFGPTSSLFRRPSGDTLRYYPLFSDEMEDIRVSAITLDQFTADAGIEHIDFLKLDIQGGELLAFEGARSLLRRRAVSVIQTECYFISHYDNAPMFWDQASYLSKYGYSFVGIYDEVWAENGQLRYADGIFVSAEVRANVLDIAPVV